uniref:zinc finger CCCH domain-containing protein 3 isoform X2 n=1 Tax=Scatophagus argus TaxID=75038 RepID=UPI001ED83E64|nr:zinc finger CCCH domain-containing protein 3 isoform X2 [Scatophagus argus]
MFMRSTDLIDKHKSVHGNTPFARFDQRQPEPSARSQSTSVIHPHSCRGRLYAPQNHASWRKTYSLKNKNPQSSAGHPSVSNSSSVHQPRPLSAAHSMSLPSHSRTATVSSGVSQQTREGSISGITGISRNTEDGKGGSSSTQHKTLHRLSPEFQQRAESRRVVSSSSEVTSSGIADSLTRLQSNPQTQGKPSLTSKVSTHNKWTLMDKTTPAVVTAGNDLPPLSSLSKVPQASSNPPTSHRQVGPSFLKKSKFTWVKTQNVGGVEPKQANSISPPTGKAVTVAPTSVSRAGVASGSSSVFTVGKRTPTRKPPRKLSPITAVPKTSKYKWVSSSVGSQAKISRKSPSPKAVTVSQRALEKGEATRKLRMSSAPSAKIKKEIVGSSTSSSLSSRYRWKAGGQSTSAATGGAPATRRSARSAFHWTSERSIRGVKRGLVGSPSATQHTSLTPSSSPGGYKLRSAMKIIRRSASSGGGSEKGTSLSAVRSSLRGRVYSSTRNPTGARRTPCKELVSFGRHKLRRLSPSFSRTSPAHCSQRGPAFQREFRTRPGSAGHTLHYNPALSWRAKRIQSARSFLQSRLRAPHDRHPSSTQHWRRSSMCWIRGSLYRVSANKLSRTAASSMSINRTGRSFSTAQVSPVSAALSRPSSTRHLASRAVQRSLAIIRQARQKKQPKQYCMYYNRFGKCNRGNSCPYIHDPDKVAVCTRFLRGTCKQADGTCPFSHKVAKEKMPVCSYFLKGICNNSDCPYSHVYVSRKAEVCEDFVKGYCPAGEKCKKKHTLVCPDFSKTGSCPRGARCKLQHRQRAKRNTSTTSSTPAKRARTREPSKRPHLTISIPQGSQAAPGTPTHGPLPLPSFISLSSSPEEADAPDSLLAETSQVKEKKLQIKPRL